MNTLHQKLHGGHEKAYGQVWRPLLKARAGSTTNVCQNLHLDCCTWASTLISKPSARALLNRSCRAGQPQALLLHDRREVATMQPGAAAAHCCSWSQQHTIMAIACNHAHLHICMEVQAPTISLACLWTS